MILDATAGNRTMWQHKNSENIIYIDIERKLERKPTIFADNTQTPFSDKVFDTIIYDPPHACSTYTGWHTYPRRSKEYFEKWGDREIPRYFGWDKYANRRELKRHIYNAQKEFHRILKDDGLLWVKWCEVEIKLDRILQYFTGWYVMLKLYISAPTQTWGKQQTYWIMLCKKMEKGVQTNL